MMTLLHWTINREAIDNWTDGKDRYFAVVGFSSANCWWWCWTHLSIMIKRAKMKRKFEYFYTCEHYHFRIENLPKQTFFLWFCILVFCVFAGEPLAHAICLWVAACLIVDAFNQKICTIRKMQSIFGFVTCTHFTCTCLRAAHSLNRSMSLSSSCVEPHANVHAHSHTHSHSLKCLMWCAWWLQFN